MSPQLDLFAAPPSPPDDDDDYLEQGEGNGERIGDGQPVNVISAQQAALLDAVAELDPDSLTPRDALDALYRLRALAKDAVATA